MAVLLLVLRLRRQLLWRRRLQHVSPFERGNLLAEARRLNRAGYSVAAVVTARIAIERLLKQMVVTHPKWRSGGSGIRVYTGFLANIGVVNRQTQKLIVAFAKKANAVTHGGPIGRTQGWRIIQRAAVVATLLEGGTTC